MKKITKVFSVATLVLMALSILVMLIGGVVGGLFDLDGIIFILGKVLIALLGAVPVLILLAASKKEKSKGEMLALIYTIAYLVVVAVGGIALISIGLLGVGFLGDWVAISAYHISLCTPFFILFLLFWSLEYLMMLFTDIVALLSKKKKAKEAKAE